MKKNKQNNHMLFFSRTKDFECAIYYVGFKYCLVFSNNYPSLGFISLYLNTLWTEKSPVAMPSSSQ